jgi:hypothetical protein
MAEESRSRIEAEAWAPNSETRSWAGFSRGLRS